MAESYLQAVVIRVANRDEITVTAERISQGISRAVNYLAIRSGVDTILTERSARPTRRSHLRWLTNAQAQCRVTNVRLEIAQERMSLCTDIRNAKDCAASDLPLN